MDNGLPSRSINSWAALEANVRETTSKVPEQNIGWGTAWGSSKKSKEGKKKLLSDPTGWDNAATSRDIALEEIPNKAGLWEQSDNAKGRHNKPRDPPTRSRPESEEIASSPDLDKDFAAMARMSLRNDSADAWEEWATLKSASKKKQRVKARAAQDMSSFLVRPQLQRIDNCLGHWEEWPISASRTYKKKRDVNAVGAPATLDEPPPPLPPPRMLDPSIIDDWDSWGITEEGVSKTERLTAKSDMNHDGAAHLPHILDPIIQAADEGEVVRSFGLAGSSRSIKPK